jgi:hypothetical protein
MIRTRCSSSVRTKRIFSLLKGSGPTPLGTYKGRGKALPFRRQTCFVHLIRDMNDELFKNPFDEEYKKMVIALGRLLRGIVQTIDQDGLKRRHLHKHIHDTDRFYRKFVDNPPSSELSIKLAKRLSISF